MTVRDPVRDLSVEGLRTRIGEMAARGRQVLADGDRVRAAVLVLFVHRAGGPVLVFGKKTEEVPHHKGQFSFPGGVVRPSDRSVIASALREAEEEVGVDPAMVEVLALFDDSPTTASNFMITPVLALAHGDPVFRPDGREIERVVEIPVAHLLDPACFHEEWWERDGLRRAVAFFQHGDDVVWGVTGRILRDILDALFPEARHEGGGP